jgi:hypothetical protein
MKYLLLISTFVLGNGTPWLCAQVAVTPSTPVVVNVGTTQQYSANIPVTWSLAPGSAGTIDADGTYHAPASLTAMQTIGGCQVLPNDHVYNTRVDALPVDQQSSAWLGALPVYPIRFEISFPQNLVTNATPVEGMTFYYTPGADGAYSFLPFPDQGVESGYWTQPFSGFDRHIVSVNTQSCQLEEVYNKYVAGSNSSCPLCTSQSGVKYGLTYDLNGGTDAAGMYIQPLALRYSELKAGVINHALRFTLPNGFLANTFRWPATSNAHVGGGSIPYGTRFRLKSSYDISRFSATAQVILLALQHYGMFLADGGQGFAIQTMADAAMDESTWSALNQEIPQSTLRSSDFEIVDESMLMESPGSGRVSPGNPYGAPLNFATVIATDMANPANQIALPVILRAVTVGAPEPAQWFLQGTPTIQLASIVNGTASTAVSWSMSPAVGTLTSSGAYTAPTLVSSPSTTTVTATSLADPNIHFSFPLTVLPSLRMNVGGLSASNPQPPHSGTAFGPDINGNFWWQGEGSAPGYGRADEWYPLTNWPSVNDIALYYTRDYNTSDTIYKFSVPNGDYNLHLMFAIGGGIGTFPRGQWKMNIDTQGVTVRTGFDVCDLVASCQQSIPGAIDIPVTVTNNRLYFALRHLADGITTSYVTLNAFSVLPVHFSRAISGTATLSGGTK